MAKELGELHDDNELTEMMERADFDNDSLVSEEEFYNLLTKKAFWFVHKQSTFIHPFQYFNTQLALDE